MKKPEHKYLVAYSRDGDCLYGRDDRDGRTQYVDAMTLRDAERHLRRFPQPGKTVVLYKIVAVKRRIVSKEDAERYHAHGLRKRKGAAR